MWKRIQEAGLAAVLWAGSLPMAATGTSAVLSLPMEEAIERALAHNRDLAKEALDVQGSHVAVQQAREEVLGFRLVPEGSAGTGPDGGDWRAGVRAEATGVLGTRVAVSTAARQLEVEDAPDQRRGEIRMEISQPLFRNFGALMRNEPVVAAGENLKTARRVWERDRSALVVRVAELYEGLIHLRHQLACDEDFADRMERLWALADAREQLGRTTRTEVMRMDLQRGEAAVRLESLRSQLDIQYREFADLLALPMDTVFRLHPPPLLELDSMEETRALAVALAERPDYAQALQDIETGERQERLARRALLPDLRLAARQSVFGEGEDWSAAGRLDQDDWFVGLVADLNLNLRGARLEAARKGIEAEARRQVAEIVRQRLALEVHGALAVYHRTRAELDLAARNRELAASRAELSRVLFDAGRARADSVSDAEEDVRRAELAELAARREASLSGYRLLHVLGTLVPAPRELLAHEN